MAINHQKILLIVSFTNLLAGLVTYSQSWQTLGSFLLFAAGFSFMLWLREFKETKDLAKEVQD